MYRCQISSEGAWLLTEWKRLYYIRSRRKVDLTKSQWKVIEFENILSMLVFKSTILVKGTPNGQCQQHLRIH